MPRSKESRQRYANSDKAKAARKRWHEANKSRRLLQCARLRAKTKGWAFNLTLEDVAIPDVCPVLGIPLFHARGGGPRDNSPTVDRVDGNLGYVKGNVIVCSSRANTIKSTATMAELRRIADFMEVWYARRR